VFAAGVPSRTRYGSLQRSPDLLARFGKGKVPTGEGKGGKGLGGKMEGKKRKGKGRGGERSISIGREGKVNPQTKILATALVPWLRY